MYWLPYSSHASHHPSQTPCLPGISYATQKLMFDSCKMVEKQSEEFNRFLCLKQNFIAYHSSNVSSRPDWNFWNSPAVTIRRVFQFLLLSLDCCTLSLIRTLYHWVLSNKVSSNIFKVWYDATWNWTQVSQTISEHSTHLANDWLK